MDGGGSRTMAVSALVVGLAALVASVAGIVKKPGQDGDIRRQLSALHEQVGQLKASCAAGCAAGGAPAACTDGCSDSAKDNAVADQLQADIEAVEAKIRALEAAARSAGQPQPPAAGQPPAGALVVGPKSPGREPAAPGRTIQAERLEIVDSSGSVRAVIDTVGGSKPSVRLLDREGRVRGEMTLGAGDDARIFLSDDDGRRFRLVPVVTSGSR